MSRISILQVPSSLGRHRQNDMEPALQVLLELDPAARLRADAGAIAATAGNATALIDLVPAVHRMPDGPSWGNPSVVHRSIRAGGLASDGPGLALSHFGHRGPVERLVDGSSVAADDTGARS